MSITLDAVIADDDPVVRAGLRVFVEADTDLEVVREAADGAEAVAVPRSVQPDVVLMEVPMPHIDGIAATAALMRLDAAPRVLVLTTFEEDALVARALAAVASGYLLKRNPAELILRAVRTVARGDVLILSPQALSLVSRLPADPDLAARLERLTPREGEVLRLVTRVASPLMQLPVGIGLDRPGAAATEGPGRGEGPRLIRAAYVETFVRANATTADRFTPRRRLLMADRQERHHLFGIPQLGLGQRGEWRCLGLDPRLQNGDPIAPAK